MDFFGDIEGEETSSVDDLVCQDFVNTLFTAAVRSRNLNKISGDTTIGDLRILIILEDDEVSLAHVLELKKKLEAARFRQIQETAMSDLDTMKGVWDILVLLGNCWASDNTWSGLGRGSPLWRLLVAGGHLAYLGPLSTARDGNGDFDEWETLRSYVPTIKDTAYEGKILKKQLLRCNHQGALYWATLPDQLKRESNLVGEIAISLSTFERRHGVLSDSSFAASVLSLKKHGMCVIRGLFDPSVVASLGDLVLADLELAKTELLKRGIDLTKPGCGGMHILFVSG